MCSKHNWSDPGYISQSSSLSPATRLNSRVLCVTNCPGGRSFERVAFLALALRRTFEFRHRTGDLLEESFGPTIRIHFSQRRSGPHIDRDVHVGIAHADVKAQLELSVVSGARSRLDDFIQHAWKLSELELQFQPGMEARLSSFREAF